MTTITIHKLDPAHAAVMDRLGFLLERHGLTDIVELVADRLFRGRQVFDLLGPIDRFVPLTPTTRLMLGALIEAVERQTEPAAMRAAAHRILDNLVGDQPERLEH